MITHLRGTVFAKELGSVILDVGGVGYRVFVTQETLGKLKKDDESVALWTHFAVREDSQDLFGFLDHDELLFFELLIKISGIGPKSALGILSVAPLPALKEAIVSSNTAYLTKVSGIGKKTAEKVVLELKDRLVREEGAGAHLSGDIDALEALTSLGYGQIESREALRSLPDTVSGTNNRVREALKLLGTKKE